MIRRTNWSSDLNVARLREIEILLRQQAMTTERLSALTGIASSTLAHFICHLRSRNSIHIADWHITGPYKGAAMFAWGEGSDAPYPTGEYRVQQADRQEFYDSRVIRRDWAVSMLFGEACA